ncbi:MAG: response regulator [Arcobacteraceae bacterium]|nr:response regulator [Arcobacteraceae bacterium]
MVNIELIKKLKILYVEDEIVLRDITVKSLGAIVQDIEVASNGKEGLEKFSAQSLEESKAFDLIITDLAMPMMDGIEMIKKIRELNQEIPILVTTAFGSQNEEVSRLSELGMSAYVMKPVDVMKLVQAIDKLLDKK